MTLTIEQFCDKFKACREGREWALYNCKDMDEVWQWAKPDWMLWIATREGVLTDMELRLFAIRCARQVQHLMDDQRSINALDVAELHINGFATDEELTAARAAADAAWVAAAAAWDAVKDADSAAYAAWVAAVAARAAADAAMAAAKDAAADAAMAARDAAMAAARDAAWVAAAAAWDADWAAVKDADSAAYAAWAADAAIRERQAVWLRENCKPKLF